MDSMKNECLFSMNVPHLLSNFLTAIKNTTQGMDGIKNIIIGNYDYFCRTFSLNPKSICYDQKKLGVLALRLLTT